MIATPQTTAARMLSLIGAVGETAAARGDWRSVLSTGVREVLHSKMGAAVDVDVSQPSASARPIQVTDSGLDPGERRILWSYLDEPGVHDPFLTNLLHLPRISRVVLRRHVVDDADWYETPLLQDYLLKAGIDDVIGCLLLVPNANTGLMIAACRDKADKAYVEADTEAMRMLQVGLAGWSRFLIEPIRHQPDRVALPRLSPRLGQLLDCFVRGCSEREAALEMCLSPHTVHMHAKRLYKAFEVRNRAELVARALGVAANSELRPADGLTPPRAA
jgi:DNA-binding CsgD family transcriptional regulator